MINPLLFCSTLLILVIQVEFIQNMTNMKGLSFIEDIKLSIKMILYRLTLLDEVVMEHVIKISMCRAWIKKKTTLHHRVCVEDN